MMDATTILTCSDRHSGIRYVSPAQRHAGQDRHILAQRHALYLQARERNPSRWSRHTRNWNPIEAVALNVELHPNLTQDLHRILTHPI